MDTKETPAAKAAAPGENQETYVLWQHRTFLTQEEMVLADRPVLPIVTQKMRSHTLSIILLPKWFSKSQISLQIKKWDKD